MAVTPQIQVLGTATGAIYFAVFLWSALFPTRRLWPPQSYSGLTAAIIWLGDLVILGAALWLGVSGWNDIGLPDWVRFGPGLAAFILGNLMIWPAMIRFGFNQNFGAKGELMKDGLYRYSRHPQYMAIIISAIGWALLSASVSVLPVLAGAVAAVIAAPFAEEPWLQETYGDQYTAYRRRTPRFIGLPKETVS